MKSIIASLPKQVEEAIQIGESTAFKGSDRKIESILICGLGGSGIGGKIIQQLFVDEIKVPFATINDYDIPAWVNANTLVIASSYSGNTEETLSAIKEANEIGAIISVITSGGELLEMAKANNWNHYVVPGGQQPRAMLAYSLVQQVYILKNYGLIAEGHLAELKGVPALLNNNTEDVQEKAMATAKSFIDKHPIIYAGSHFEGIATRFRQQINENGKMLCWHHILPEMTHNELVGWAGGSNDYVPIFFKTDFDHKRTGYRWEICKEVIGKYTDTILEFTAKGDNKIAQNFYLIHFGDWVSWFISEIKDIDAEEVEVIKYLKGEMGKKA
ncbi:bifunctional phosphoglucose/phosphomannose isomerase [Crocinitomix catalasitica]|uniref:bifunctional phosphoglucose/phosphomannose isomerase n=1 Tax=Crocinitomix catalasitica TaxID=184607 RepID=UPI000487B212|nr:bifunctional phosphoglucose/phosphomannose isomerase [Crocinitomix catalasitica]